MSNSTRFSKIVWLRIIASWLDMLIGSQVIGLFDSATVSVPVSSARAVRSQAEESTAAAAVRKVVRREIVSVDGVEGIWRSPIDWSTDASLPHAIHVGAAC